MVLCRSFLTTIHPNLSVGLIRSTSNSCVTYSNHAGHPMPKRIRKWSTDSLVWVVFCIHECWVLGKTRAGRRVTSQHPQKPLFLSSSFLKSTMTLSSHRRPSTLLSCWLVLLVVLFLPNKHPNNFVSALFPWKKRTMWCCFRRRHVSHCIHNKNCCAPLWWW